MALLEKLQRLSNPQRDAEEERRLAEWQAAVRGLLADVVQWLRDYIDQGLMQAAEDEARLHDDELGYYQAEALTLQLGAGQRLEFVPYGRVVAGAEGRVDLIRTGDLWGGYMLLHRPEASLLAAAAVPHEPGKDPAWVFWRRHESAVRSDQPVDPRIRNGTPLSRVTLELAIDGMLA